MTTPLPIACSLTPEGAAERVREWRELGAKALVEKTSIKGGVRLVFRQDEGVQAALLDLVAAERECCPFLTLAVRDSAATIDLDITGPPDAGPIEQLMRL